RFPKHAAPCPATARLNPRNPAVRSRSDVWTSPCQRRLKPHQAPSSSPVAPIPLRPNEQNRGSATPPSLNTTHESSTVPSSPQLLRF
uniref:Uncharacterized protein n=1 Tax=Aegilops tauschii subsp. strangulata TaxID=200361 RepID=A0A453F2N5_AEGTS